MRTAGVQRAEILQTREVHGETYRLPGDKRRVLHEELALVRPIGDGERRNLWLGRGRRLTVAGHRQRAGDDDEGEPGAQDVRSHLRNLPSADKLQLNL